jgi:hypothetical protein
MKFVIKAGSYAGGHPSGAEGKYLEFYNPNAQLGDVGGWTTDLAKALRFDSLSEAHKFATQRRTLNPDPARPDDDRPLTAYDLTFELIKE